MNCGKKISGELVIARCDGAKVLNFVEKSLDKVALAVEGIVAVALHLAVGFRRNDRGDATLFERGEQRIGVKRLIADQSARISIFEQRFCTGQIVILSWRQHQFEGIAQGVAQRGDFGTQSAARSPDRLRTVFFRAPALCW